MLTSMICSILIRILILILFNFQFDRLDQFWFRFQSISILISVVWINLIQSISILINISFCFTPFQFLSLVWTFFRLIVIDCKEYCLSTSIRNIVCQHRYGILFVNIDKEYCLSTSIRNIVGQHLRHSINI